MYFFFLEPIFKNLTPLLVENRKYPRRVQKSCKLKICRGDGVSEDAPLVMMIMMMVMSIMLSCYLHSLKSPKPYPYKNMGTHVESAKVVVASKFES
jgi:hypothetical protein